MLHRRINARHHFLAALLLTVSLGATLSSCGFDAPTDRINQIGPGANNRDGEVKLLGIRVLSTAAGEGRVIGAIDNELTDKSASLTGITNTEGGAFTPGFQPVEIPADSAVNLSTLGGLSVTGDFRAGDVLPLEFTFDNGETHQVQVPVVKDCYQYTAVPSPSESSSETPSESASPSSESSAGDLYKCSDEESAPTSSSEGE